MAACSDCAKERGGYGLRAQHPLPACWQSAAEVGEPWCRELADLYVCSRCGAMHAVHENRRDELTNFSRLPVATRHWLRAESAVCAILDSFMQAQPLTEPTTECGVEVLRQLRAHGGSSPQSQADAVLERLAAASATGSVSRALLGVLLSMGNVFTLPNADALLAPHLLADRHWLLELGRLVRGPLRPKMSQSHLERLRDACDPGRLARDAVQRMKDAFRNADYPSIDNEISYLFSLRAQDLRPPPDVIEALEQIRLDVLALTADTIVPRASFGDSTPTALGESIARLIVSCKV